jgi:hypothetical protein
MFPAAALGAARTLWSSADRRAGAEAAWRAARPFDRCVELLLLININVEIDPPASARVDQPDPGYFRRKTAERPRSRRRVRLAFILL